MTFEWVDEMKNRIAELALKEKQADAYEEIVEGDLMIAKQRIKELEAELAAEVKRRILGTNSAIQEKGELEAELCDRHRRHAADVEERDRKIAELREDIRLEGK